NGGDEIDGVNRIKENARKLNSGMGKLRQGVGDKDEVKGREDYGDGDRGKENAYNSGVSSAERIINERTNGTMCVDDVNGATSGVTCNKNGLNGDEKLAECKRDGGR
ncbi:FIVAR domain-containing protein, partial [Staphylococcus aureus]|uniref:FIVAR domain-containing protein n=1 Tax=Staphylococcus aureus TaxID=1280 RepID=UPI0011A98C2A